MSETLEYYNLNANKFFESTVNVNMINIYKKFEAYLPKAAKVMDLGCGSGRDSLHFINKGYEVTAIDGSIELCKKASVLIGQKVKCMTFKDINVQNYFDGIWACASLLHIEKKDLVSILNKLSSALKKNGVMYISFKYGDHEEIRNGRFFTDLKEESFQQLLARTNGLNTLETWITGDVRKGRNDEKWLNVVVKK